RANRAHGRRAPARAPRGAQTAAPERARQRVTANPIMSLPPMHANSAFARHHARLLELLRERAFEERQVTLSSGKTSNFYIDTKQVSLTAEGHFLVGQLFRAVIEHNAPGAEAIGGMT